MVHVGASALSGGRPRPARRAVLVASMAAGVASSLAAAGCAPRGGDGGPGAGPITSAGDPGAPVAVVWSTHAGRTASDHRLLVEGGTLHAIPSEMRLLDATGTVVASAPALPTSDGSPGLCGAAPGGLARAALPISAADLQRLRAGTWPPALRLELRVGGRWQPAAPTYAGCVSGD